MVADEYVGHEVYVDWPHLQEVKIIAVSNDKMKISLSDECRKHGGKIQTIRTPQYDESAQWGRKVDEITDR